MLRDGRHLGGDEQLTKLTTGRFVAQLAVFALAIVLGSLIGVAISTDMAITNPLEQTATVIVVDFLVYLGILHVAPKSRPAAGE